MRTNYTTITKDKSGPFALNCCTKLTSNAYYKDAAPYVTAIQDALTDYTSAASIKTPFRSKLRSCCNTARCSTRL